jgi:hypothetical protein
MGAAEREGRIDMIKVIADTINGVREVECFDYDCEVMDQEDFYDSLKNVADGETVAADLDYEMLVKIDEEYGITLLDD